MREMVEPDRTILIVSIIGLVVIWGSVAYHRFVQGGPAAAPEEADGAESSGAGEVQARPLAAPPPEASPTRSGDRSRRRGKGRRR